MSKILKINFTLFLLGIIISFYFSNFFVPSEDAAILFRYSENLSETGIISYNFNGVRSEGATDFLWMLILSFFKKLGFDIYFISVFLNLISIVLSSNILVRHFKLDLKFIYFIILAHIPFGFFWASIFGFSNLFVELVLICLLISFDKNDYKKILFFSFVGTLIRPDFILFCILINIYYLFKINKKSQIIYLILYIFFGLLYFVLRFKYFGLLFPLPYYVKSQWIFFENLGWLKQIIIFIPVIFLLISQKINLNIKNLILFFSFLIIPSFYYSNQILYQNIGQRFYFYFFPFFIFFIFYSFSSNFKVLEKKIYFTVLCACLLSLSINVFYERDVFPFDMKKYKDKNYSLKKNSNIIYLSKALKNIDNELKLATTEAGLLPYLTKYNTIDLFGLNTPIFARYPAGGKYLSKKDFDVIIINTGQEETNCEGLSKILDKASAITKLDKQKRNINWDEFTLQLFSGISLEKYKIFLFPYYTDKSNTYIILRKNNLNFNKLENILLEKGSTC